MVVYGGILHNLLHVFEIASCKYFAHKDLFRLKHIEYSKNKFLNNFFFITSTKTKAQQLKLFNYLKLKLVYLSENCRLYISKVVL
jgi:hypothetical protein